MIRRMTERDLDFAAGCTAEVGWVTETRAALEGFLRHDPRGCLIAESGGRRIGICVATPLGEAGFIGELIVRRDARGGGMGPRLLDAALEYLRNHGVRSIYLDGVRPAVPYYRGLGFRKVCRSLRFLGLPPAGRPSGIRPMRASDLDAVAALDAEAFGADRSFFLRRRFELASELCHVDGEGGSLCGYIMGFRGDGVIAAGPWVADDSCDRPLALLESLGREASGSPVRVGVLESHARAVGLMRSFPGFREQAPSWRMAMGDRDDLGASAACLAVGSPAKG